MGMNRGLILAGLAMLALTAAVAQPVAAHEDDDRYGRGGYGRDWGYSSRRDRDHDREHYKLDRKHAQAHRRGFDDRRDHKRWHRKAGKHHDGDHHRIYDEHAPNRRYYYGDDRDDYRYDRYGSRYRYGW